MNVWFCPDCPWNHFPHPVYGWCEADDRAVEVHKTMLCPARVTPSDAGKWREAGWKSPDDILAALTALELRVRELRDSFTPMVDKGSGSYLNPRIVVARLDEALTRVTPPAGGDA